MNSVKDGCSFTSVTVRASRNGVVTSDILRRIIYNWTRNKLSLLNGWAVN
jgi:hypothetical protein